MRWLIRDEQYLDHRPPMVRIELAVYNYEEEGAEDMFTGLRMPTQGEARPHTWTYFRTSMYERSLRPLTTDWIL